MKRKLADVLWEAANERLANETFTCYCAALACGYDPYTDEWSYTTRLPALKFFRSLGCKTNALDQFDSFNYGEERQGVRYMWLLLAMHVADDEGIEIEVAA